MNDARAVVGTVGSIAALNAGAGAGRLVGALRGDGALARSLAMSWSTGAALVVAGIRVQVDRGRRNLDAPRPAVFLMNHQSELDPLVAGTLIRHDATATGKKEAKLDPRAGFLGWALDVVHFDRGNPEKAREASAELERRVRSGVSVLVAPEGTRSPTATPLPFKKGAFHIAMNTGVPIIPIVMRNCGELMPKGSKTMRPGTVRVAVLDPIDTSTWTKETLGEHVEAVHSLYVETLENWPGVPSA